MVLEFSKIKPLINLALDINTFHQQLIQHLYKAMEYIQIYYLILIKMAIVVFVWKYSKKIEMQYVFGPYY